MNEERPLHGVAVTGNMVWIVIESNTVLGYRGVLLGLHQQRFLNIINIINNGLHAYS